MSIPGAFLAPVLKSKPSATRGTTNSNLPPLGRTGKTGLASARPTNEDVFVPKTRHKIHVLSARGVTGEGGAQILPPSVPPGPAPPPALASNRNRAASPAMDSFSARGVAGERSERLAKGTQNRQVKVPSKLLPLAPNPPDTNLPVRYTQKAASQGNEKGIPSQRQRKGVTTEAHAPQDSQSRPSSESPAPRASLLPEVELLEGQFSAVSAQLREQSIQLLESQNSLQRQAESLEKALHETSITKEAEAAHSRKLAEAFSRESARCEEVRHEIEEAKLRKQILQSELDDLQVKRFRATELTSHAGLDQELLMVLRAENEALLEELRCSYSKPDIENEISMISQELRQNEPIIQQLRSRLTEVYVSNTELQQQIDKLSKEHQSLQEDLGISKSSPHLSESSESDTDVDEDHCVSMLFDPEKMDVNLRINVPRSLAEAVVEALER